MRPPPEGTLTQRTSQAVGWRFAASVTGAASQFAIGVLLARLLRPADFGLLGLAALVIALARLTSDLGTGTALVQRRELTAAHVRAAFTLSTSLGVALALLVFTLAPGLAAMMNEVRLAPVLRVLSLTFVISGFGVTASAELRRSLAFRELFLIDLGSYVCGYGLCAVLLALSGHGVWSLVWGTVSQVLLATGAQLWLTRHPMALHFRLKEYAELMRFGFGATIGSLVNFVATSGDNFIVGRWIGVLELGLYSRAYSLMNLPHTYTASVISGVLLPAFSEVQAEPQRLRRGFLIATELTAIVAGPAMTALAVAAPHLVTTVYGPEWEGSVAPLRILCAAGYFRALYHLGGMTAYSAGRVYSDLWRQVIYATFVLAGSVAGVRYGMSGVAWGVTVAVLYMYIATGSLALAVTATSWRTYLRAQQPALILTIATLMSSLMLRRSLEVLKIPSPVIALVLVIGSAGLCVFTLLRRLGHPKHQTLRDSLPPQLSRLAAIVRSSSCTQNAEA